MASAEPEAGCGWVASLMTKPPSRPVLTCRVRTAESLEPGAGQARSRSASQSNSI